MDDPPRPSFPSSSSSSSKDVFISFRGPDTRKSFVCHLHNALERQLVSAYLDTENLRQGDDVSNLFRAIAEAKISIVVLSQNYATSTWCLKELVKIMECKEQHKQLVIPIFYDGVEPSHVGYQLGSFGKAFDKHKRARRVDNTELESWKRALLEASKISGSCSDEFGDDTKLIDAVVKRVSKELLHKSAGSEESGLVGIEFRIERMKLAPPLEMDKFRKVGIWGTGGIGKTTTAKTVFNRIHSQFFCCCLVEKVYKDFQEGGVGLLKHILSKLLDTNEVQQINTEDQAYEKMKELQRRRVLVVLDDVDKKKQIDTLLDGLSFGKGSIIIVTTRDRDLLDEFDDIYEVDLLSESDALILFSKKAFKTETPPEEYVHLSERVVKYAKGLPLALQVMGGLLGPRKTAFEWEQELDKIMNIQNVLKRSYDGLDDFQKDIFLDIACFFRGMDLDYVRKVLDECRFYASTGIRNLVDRALITISKLDKIEMHDLIQDMGKKIESKAEQDGKRKRFWSEDAKRALSENTVTECGEGLMIDLPNKESISFNAEAFERMRKLRLLSFTHRESYFVDLDEGENHGKNHLIGDLKFLSSELRVLKWHRYPLKCLPSNLNPKNLLELDMRYSHIEQLWEGFKCGNKLKSINLSGSRNLKETPDLTELPNLERLDLGGCYSLKEVHPSIFSHKNLVFFSLAYCHELKRLPNSMHMKSLETLDLSECTDLEMFPEISGDMEALSKLQLVETAIKELPSSIDRLKGLQSLYMSRCKSLDCLPESICNLDQLRILNLAGCLKLKKLPKDIGWLQSLSELLVSHSGLEELPVSMLRLKLSKLSFRWCRQMAAPLSSWPSSIEDGCAALVELDFRGCNLRELSNAIAHFFSLKVLNLSKNNNLESLPAIMNKLGCLERLDLDSCTRLKSIPELSSSISYINAHNCTALKTLSAPQSPYDIGRCFTFSNCSQLVQEDIFRDIVETHFPPQGNPFRSFRFCLPGSEIPKQYIHQCRGSSVTARLPQDWFDNKFLGFAICAVTHKPRVYGYSRLTVRCFCTFKGDHCMYRSNFCLFDSLFEELNLVESKHILVGYMPWSEFGINIGEAANELSYTEAKFEIELGDKDERVRPYYYRGEFEGRFDEPCMEMCGVRFFFGNNMQDFGEPMVQVDNSEKILEVEPSDITRDTFSEDKEHLTVLSQVFEGANRKPSYTTIEDSSFGNRETLETWTQLVKINLGLRDGDLFDGFNKFCQKEGIERFVYGCDHQLGCWAEAIVSTPSDPTIFEITYVGRHTCWKTQPMLTYQVRITPDMEIEGPSDGFRWRKYGEMDTRVYYVCNPQNVGGCMAVKEVQRCNDEKFFKITYRLRHTCKLPSTGPSIFSHKNLVSFFFDCGLVGIQPRKNKMILAPADHQRYKFRAVGIWAWGSGVIGKTTIATTVFNRIHSQFFCCCLVEKVSKKFHVGGAGLQEHIRSKLLYTNEESQINTEVQAYEKMNEVQRRGVLVVLGDVDNRMQIDALLYGPPYGEGSIIIVTTRDRGLLHKFDDIYEVEILSESDALILFSKNAFKTDKPPEEYVHLSERAVKYAKGLPLALRVMGGLLGTLESTSDWERELEKIMSSPHVEIQNVLERSYNGLDDLQKAIFLDIACCFRGWNLDLVTKILDDCGFHASAKSGIQNLVDRALITISKSDEIEMHDFIQEVGNKIESKAEEGKRKRFWSEDAECALSENTITECAERLRIDLPNNEDVSFNAEAFERMRKLRLLSFTHRESYFGDLDERENHGKNHLIGDLKFLSSELRVLKWHRYPLKCLPSNFDPKNLFVLDMKYSHIEKLWVGYKCGNKLKSINLSRSENLKETPDLTELPNLERLDLSGCDSLTEVHPSIFSHKILVFLSLGNCTRLKRLPSSIHMKSLETLDLGWCKNLKMFPEIWGDMEALSKLDLKFNGVKELPSSIDRLKGLQSLDMYACESLVCLPESICNLDQLRSLQLTFCSKLKKLPENIGSLESLEKLDVSFSGLEELPVSMLRLKLSRLSFWVCKHMAAPLSSWPSSIEDRCTALVELNFSDCNLMELSDAIAYFSSLKVLNLSENDKLESLPTIMNELGCLERLELDGCKRLKSIPELSSSISYINAHNCTDLETVPAPQSRYDIGRCFRFSNCNQLVQEDLFRDIVETHFPPQGNPFRPFYFSLPGSEIPKQFIHRCRGSSVTARLPPNWFDNQFLGFAICAVTNQPQGVEYYQLTARCFCTFKGDHCKYRFSFCLFDSDFSRFTKKLTGEYNNELESNHILVGYMPWSEFGINGGEAVNERSYAEAKFEIELKHCNFRRKEVDEPCIERCGVQFFFGNINVEDVGEPMVQVDNSIRSLEVKPSTSDNTSDTFDEYKELLTVLSQVFKGANIEPSYTTIEDSSFGNRESLETWTQQVRVTSGLMQGYLDDGFNWSGGGGGGIQRYRCGSMGCWVKAEVPDTSSDPTILEVTYVGRHTCWETQPMLTYQVRNTPDMEIEGPSDGFRWRKYGERDPRVFYVCNPQHVGGCMAVKEVQRFDDPTFLRITYRLRHTCTLPSTSIGGKVDSSTSVALSVDDRVIELPSSPGANGRRENAIRLVDNNTEDDDIVNMLPDANSPDKEHFPDTRDVENNDMAVCDDSGGVASEGVSEAVVNGRGCLISIVEWALGTCKRYWHGLQ